MSSLTPYARARALVVMLLLLFGLAMAPAAPVLAADCAARGAGADLRYCNLSGLDLSGVTLTGADLRGANLRNTNLNGARLAGANLAYADLRGASFSGANLRGANLTGATVYKDTLDGADVRGANLNVRTVPSPTPIPPMPVVTLSFTFAGIEFGVTYCSVNVQVSGFSPSTTYAVIVFISDFEQSSLQGSVVTDGSGNAATTLFSIDAATIRLQVNGVNSNTSAVACSAP